jgi:ribosomal-protein-alanine N-acetyltransferase
MTMPLPFSNYSTLDKSTTLIRPTTIRDIPSVYGIEVQSFKDPYSHLLLMNLLALYPNGFYVAEVGGRIVGYAIFRFVAHKGHIIALAVDERGRNRNIGTSLLKKAIEAFKKRGASGAWLEVRSSNLRAQRFYAGRGFERIRTVQRYYSDGEDAEILYMTLSS